MINLEELVIPFLYLIWWIVGVWLGYEISQKEKRDKKKKVGK